MKPSGIITLLTDFGLADPYVGVMKGAILGRFRGATLVDLTHQIPPQALGIASFWLQRSYCWFPEGTVHLVVVDPGVGSERRALALEARGHYFVGPDNGVFAPVLRAARGARVVSIEPERLALGPLSRTFHGRDLFGPAAAALASGASALAELGPSVSLELVPEAASAAPAAAEIRGSVVTVDHFGNLITNIEAANLALEQPREVRVAGRRLRIVETYAQADAGECVALLGSFGTLEIAVRDASAAAVLGVGPGVRVVVAEPGHLL